MNFAILALLAFLIVLVYRQKPSFMVVWLVIALGLSIFTGHTAYAIIGVMLGCVLLGQPLFVLMGGITLLSFYAVIGYREIDELVVIVDKLLELASKEVLLAIPFFVVAGELMTQGSLAKRLIEVARAVFGFMPGGLAVAGVAGCVFFAAISGSSPVTVVAIGSIMVPALVKRQYPEGFSIGLLTSAGSLGILIPPSIPMIIYAIMVGTSTPMDPKDLFLGGVIPGLLIGGMLAAYSIFIGIKHKLPREKFDIRRIGREIVRGFWSLLLPLLILGGIYSGVFTTTEAAAVSVVYALVVEIFIHGELKAKDLVSVAENSMTVMGALLLIIGLALGLNHVLVEEQVPDRMVAWIQSLDLGRGGFLILTNLFLLLLGCFMDIMSAILIVAPMLSPMAVALGVDPIHMGIIFIVNLEIGYLTPPLGLNLFVASTIFRRSIGEVIRSVLTPIAILFSGLMLITWVPWLSTGLVDYLNSTPKVPVKTKVVPKAKEKSLKDLMNDTKDSGKTKSLKDLMREADEGAEGAESGGKAKTLKELMQAADEGEEAENVPAKAKTLKELMQAADENETAEAPVEEVPAKAKTLKELMQEADAKEAP